MLRMGDLEGRVLSIERNLSLEVLGPTKTNRNRRLTLGATTARMIVDLNLPGIRAGSLGWVLSFGVGLGDVDGRLGWRAHEPPARGCRAARLERAKHLPSWTFGS